MRSPTRCHQQHRSQHLTVSIANSVVSDRYATTNYQLPITNSIR
ncbi:MULTISPECIES: hypothetical protein [Chroococcidiopsis]|nr:MULTISPECIES: hypothetical protein [Chroococcidiopsis]